MRKRQLHSRGVRPCDHKEHLFPERNQTESSSFTLSLVRVQNVGGAGKDITAKKLQGRIIQSCLRYGNINISEAASLCDFSLKIISRRVLVSNIWYEQTSGLQVFLKPALFYSFPLLLDPQGIYSLCPFIASNVIITKPTGN